MTIFTFIIVITITIILALLTEHFRDEVADKRDGATPSVARTLHVAHVMMLVTIMMAMIVIMMVMMVMVVMMMRCADALRASGCNELVTLARPCPPGGVNTAQDGDHYHDDEIHHDDGD